MYLSLTFKKKFQNTKNKKIKIKIVCKTISIFEILKKNYKK